MKGFMFLLLTAVLMGTAGAPAAAAPDDDPVGRGRAEMARRLADVKADPDSVFYVRSDLSPVDQEGRAEALLRKIREQTGGGGFSSPDPDDLLALTMEILRQAPATRAAQMAHWNLHTLALAAEQPALALQALLTYLDKYPEDQGHWHEAWDKLSVLAQKSGDWGMALIAAEQLLQRDPDNAALRLTKARAWLHLGETVAGRRLLEKIIRDEPDSVQARLAQNDLAALAAGPAGGPSSGVARADDLVAAYRLTMERMKKVLAGVQMYALEYMKLPDTIEQMVETRYLEAEHARDAWNRPLHFKADPERNGCWVASAGSDGKFEGFDQRGGYADLTGRDIVAFDIDFTCAPSFTR
jgi:tetratricopeptide (TPR) repeat protein